MSRCDRGFIVLFRLLMAWTFLFAASHQAFDPAFSIIGFLKNTKTFHDVFAPFTSPGIAPVVSVLVAWGHLLIGLSLLTGLLVRVSAGLGMLLMILYWLAHMDFPYISNHNNFLVDEHIVNAAVLALLIASRAGHVCGLDGWAAKFPAVCDNPLSRWAVSAE